MIVGVAGLGHIGGSMAKAAGRFTPHRVLGLDADPSTERAALEEGAIDGVLDEEGLSACDLLLVALYPSVSVKFIADHAQELKKGCCVTDLCGIKAPVCDAVAPIARRQGFHFVGGHPMAGRAEWGYRASSEDLFAGAPMILSPSPGTPGRDDLAHGILPRLRLRRHPHLPSGGTRPDGRLHLPAPPRHR